MKALSIESIKKEVKEISGRRIAIAAALAVMFSIYAVLRLPLRIMGFSTVDKIASFFVALIPLFAFYVLVKIPGTSVFKVLKCVYCVCVPFILMFTADALFDPNDAELYPDSFYGSFMVRWIIVWWVGTVLLYAVLCLLEHVIRTGYNKHKAGAAFLYDLAVMFTPQKRLAAKKSEGKKRTGIFILCMLMVALGVFISSVTLFLYNIYSNMEFEAILFTMLYSAGTLAVEDIIIGTEYTLLFIIIAGYICWHIYKCLRHESITVADTGKEKKYTLQMNGKKRAFLVIFSFVVMIGGLALFSAQTGFLHYVSVKSDKSDIYEKYYVEPTAENVIFPEEKRNLIFIYLESMESTYADKESGGDMLKNYIPELTEMVKNGGINFSNTDKLGGASVYVPAITYTMGSTVAQTSGVATDTGRSRIFGPKEFPSGTTLEDSLPENGYNQG
jgi:phosphoglycerol transferase